MFGLTEKEVRERIARGEVNLVPDASAKTVGGIIRENICTYFNLIFAVLAFLLLLSGSVKSLSFIPIVVINTVIGCVQEIRAKQVLDRLTILHEATAVVLRDGQRKTIPVSGLVKDDVILLASGNQIPADAVVVDGEITVNESLLTGESDEITKRSGQELMSGSFVVTGTCAAKLTAVGRDSYISKLTVKAKAIGKVQKSEMIRGIDRLVKIAGALILPIGAILVYQGIAVRQQAFAPTITSMVGAVVGMIPEGLYLTVSIALATSAARLAKQAVMLHDMKSIESLSRVDVICVDKTGTITDNEMQVEEIIALGDDAADADGGEWTPDRRAELADYIAALPDNNLTMQALRSYCGAGSGKKALAVHPFSSRYKYSAVGFEDGAYVLGAPEFVLTERYADYMDQIGEYARRGSRVLAYGKVTAPAEIGTESAAPAETGTESAAEGAGKPAASAVLPTQGLSGVKVLPRGLVILHNPVRENAKKTFEYFRQQGVEVKVISGDNPATVSAVAEEAGIDGAERYVDASTLDTEEKVRAAASKYNVFGRTTPEQKQQLVQALKRAGHTVAMTGDGVNDILAMKKADCSIAMAAGSDAAVQAAEVVLLDSDFSHMPEIVAEGRRTVNNVERSTSLYLVKNFFSLFMALFSIFSIMRYPLEPSHLTLISIFNIGLPTLLLTLEPRTERVRKHFFRRVCLRAIPFALTDFLSVAAMVVFGWTFHIESVEVSVASTFLVAIVGFIILYKICSPLNRFRTAILVGCIAGFLIGGLVFNNFFSITAVTKECAMLFVLFAIATEACSRFLEKVVLFVKSRMRNAEEL